MKKTIFKLGLMGIMATQSTMAATPMETREFRDYLSLMRTLGHDGTVNFYSSWEKKSRRYKKRQIKEATDFAKFQFGTDLNNNTVLKKNISIEEQDVCTRWEVVKTSETRRNENRSSSNFDMSSSMGLSTSVAAAGAGLVQAAGILGLGPFGLVGGLFGSLGIAAAGSASFDGFFDFGVSNSSSSEQVDYYHVTRDVKCTKYKKYQRAKVAITPDIRQLSSEVIAQTSYEKILKLQRYMIEKSNSLVNVVEAMIEEPVIDIHNLEQRMRSNTDNYHNDALVNWLKLNIQGELNLNSLNNALKEFGDFLVAEIKSQKDVLEKMERNDYISTNFNIELEDIKAAHTNLLTLISRLDQNELNYLAWDGRNYVGPFQVFDKMSFQLITLPESQLAKIENREILKDYNAASVDFYQDVMDEVEEARGLYRQALANLPENVKIDYITPAIKDASFWSRNGYFLRNYYNVYSSRGSSYRVHKNLKAQIIRDMNTFNCRVAFAIQAGWNKTDVQLVCKSSGEYTDAFELAQIQLEKELAEKQKAESEAHAMTKIYQESRKGYGVLDQALNQSFATTTELPSSYNSNSNKTLYGYTIHKYNLYFLKNDQKNKATNFNELILGGYKLESSVNERAAKRLINLDGCGIQEMYIDEKEYYHNPSLYLTIICKN